MIVAGLLILVLVLVLAGILRQVRVEFGGQKRLHHFFGGLDPHIEDLGCFPGERGVSGTEQPFDGAGVTGGDFQFPVMGQPFEVGIIAGGHFAEVSHRIEGNVGIAQLFQHGLFDLFGDSLCVGAVTE
jgi:hypothetical protein